MPKEKVYTCSSVDYDVVTFCAILWLGAWGLGDVPVELHVGGLGLPRSLQTRSSGALFEGGET